MSKLKTIYNRLFREQSDLSMPPVINKAVHSLSKESYSGGSLADKNVLLVSNDRDLVPAFISRYKTENCYLKVVPHTNELTMEGLQNAEREMIGHCDSIVNIINENADKDSVKQTYRWFQVESPFLSAKYRQATVCTVLIVDTRERLDAMKPAFIHLISSIATLINNHNIVVNAILAMPTANMEEITATSAFLSSKYGEALTGETIVIG